MGLNLTLRLLEPERKGEEIEDVMVGVIWAMGHGRLPDGACAAPDGDTESEDMEEEGAQERGGTEEC